jgi:hypothetical protein
MAREKGMTTSIIAVARDGVWQAPGSNVVAFDASRSEVDQIADHLAQVVKLAQTLSEADARRTRDLMHAASALLTATTYLSGPDQARLERALRK